jgi:hypothetical protein
MKKGTPSSSIFKVHTQMRERERERGGERNRRERGTRET